MPDIERQDSSPAARRGPTEVQLSDRERRWMQGAQAAVARDMQAEVSGVRIVQVFGPLETDAALLELETDQGAYQVVVGKDESFTIF